MLPLIVSFLIFAPCAWAQTPALELLALRSIYDSLSGATWSDPWPIDNSSSDPCTWEGLSCTDRHITTLDIDERNAQGTVPDQAISALTRLQWITITGNPLVTGPLPSLTNLSLLEGIAFGNNSFSGPIPETWNDDNHPSLVDIHLWQNRLTGGIPTGLQSLPNLWVLDASKNQLSGKLPKFISRELVWLDLGYNQFHGELEQDILPPSRGVGGRRLHLNDNRLSGQIPLFSEHERLYYIILHNNLFTSLTNDSLPIHVGHFVCDNCTLSGPLPSLNRTNLEVVILSNNRFTGCIGAISRNLHTLLLQNNQLTGPMPMWSERGSLIVVDLSGNALSGTIQIPPPSHTGLREFRVAKNHLVGNNISALAIFPMLYDIDVSENLLSGDVPMFQPFTDPFYIDRYGIKTIKLGCNQFTTTNINTTGIIVTSECYDGQGDCSNCPLHNNINPSCVVPTATIMPPTTAAPTPTPTNRPTRPYIDIAGTDPWAVSSVTAHLIYNPPDISPKLLARFQSTNPCYGTKMILSWPIPDILTTLDSNHVDPLSQQQFIRYFLKYDWDAAPYSTSLGQELRDGQIWNITGEYVLNDVVQGGLYDFEIGILTSNITFTNTSTNKSRWFPSITKDTKTYLQQHPLSPIISFRANCTTTHAKLNEADLAGNVAVNSASMTGTTYTSFGSMFFALTCAIGLMF